jgi:hypothetical protein
LPISPPERVIRPAHQNEVRNFGHAHLPINRYQAEVSLG